MSVDLQDNATPSRRDVLAGAGGLGAVASGWLLHRDAVAAAPSNTQAPHFPARAKRIVQIFCCGGVSHLDTFDHKPELAKLHGKELTNKGKLDPFFGRPGRLMKSPFAFKRHGRSGQWVSDLLPNLATCVDDICFIKSMVAKNNNHTPATFAANSGFTMNGFPSMGSWLSYGLGNVVDELPAFVVLPDPRGLPAGGSINWTAGFLPAAHQGTAFATKQGQAPIAALNTPTSIKPGTRKASFALLQRMNLQFADAHRGDSSIAARVRAYELAARMQLSVPAVVDLSKESKDTRDLYGVDDPANEGFGRNCLLARRLLERGVRFVQLFNGGAFGKVKGRRINWDGHEDVISNHKYQSQVMDRPVAGLLKDLKRRGMLDDTLVVWSTEFGRTPITQGVGSTGRDHHQHAYTCWLAGAGVKGGHTHGASDEVGYFAAESPVTTYDFHATVLHLLGLDHERLTYYHNGIMRRLTDVHGHVVGEVLT